MPPHRLRGAAKLKHERKQAAKAAEKRAAERDQGEAPAI
jgi:hypothetical protein